MKGLQAVIRYRLPLPAIILALGLAGVLSACATGPRIVNHGFQFSVSSDSPDVELLNYRYGNSGIAGTRAPDWALQQGKIGQSMGSFGDMPVGDTLYAKWRVKATGEVFEDTVDLKNRLPRDISRHEIYFMIRGPQLHVYLISPERRPADFPEAGPKYAGKYYKVYSIYPESPLGKSPKGQSN